MGMLDGKVAIITGSGRGIGSAAARLFAAEGAAVVVSDLDPAPAEETAAAIRARVAGLSSSPGDVTSPAFPAQLIKATLDAFGGMDIIVNNAGYTWDAVIQNMTDKQWYAMIDVHTTAPFPHFARGLAIHSRRGQEGDRRQRAGQSAQDRQRHLRLRRLWQRGSGQLLDRQSRHHRPDKDAGKGMGPLQRAGQLRLLRLHRHAPDRGQREAEKVQRDGEEIALGVPDQMRQMAPMLIPLVAPARRKRRLAPCSSWPLRSPTTSPGTSWRSQAVARYKIFNGVPLDEPCRRCAR